jgi:hypothetical protein
MQADLGDQAGEIHETTDGFVRAEETRDEGHGREDRGKMTDDRGKTR